MELPEGKVIVFLFVALLAVFSYFGFDLKQILQDKISNMFPPLDFPASKAEYKFSPAKYNSFMDPPTVSPQLDQLLNRRSVPHPIETVPLR